MEYKVTQNGEPIGFNVQNAGLFGENLFVGQNVEFDDGSLGVITGIGNCIHAGRPGVANFIFVDIDKENDEK